LVGVGVRVGVGVPVLVGVGVRVLVDATVMVGDGTAVAADAVATAGPALASSIAIGSMQRDRRPDRSQPDDVERSPMLESQAVVVVGGASEVGANPGSSQVRGGPILIVLVVTGKHDLSVVSRVRAATSKKRVHRGADTQSSNIAICCALHAYPVAHSGRDDTSTIQANSCNGLLENWQIQEAEHASPFDLHAPPCALKAEKGERPRASLISPMISWAPRRSTKLSTFISIAFGSPAVKHGRRFSSSFAKQSLLGSALPSFLPITAEVHAGLTIVPFFSAAA
jgi:hypothetical protein